MKSILCEKVSDGGAGCIPKGSRAVLHEPIPAGWEPVFKAESCLHAHSVNHTHAVSYGEVMRAEGCTLDSALSFVQSCVDPQPFLDTLKEQQQWMAGVTIAEVEEAKLDTYCPICDGLGGVSGCCQGCGK